MRAAPPADRRPRHLRPSDNDTSSTAACTPHPWPTVDHTTCPPTTTTRAAAPPARRTRRGPRTTPLAPRRQRHVQQCRLRAAPRRGPKTTPLARRRQRHVQQRRLRAAPAADRRQHDLPPDDNDTSSSAACAPQPPRTKDHANCPPTTTTRAAPPRARRTCGRPTTTPLAPQSQRHKWLRRVRAALAAERRPRHCPPKSTTQAVAPCARRTSGRPKITRLAPKRQRHEQHRRVHDAPAADRRPRHLPPKVNDTSSCAVCAPHQRPTEHHTTRAQTTTTRAAPPVARRIRGRPTTTPLAPQRQ